MPRLAGDFSAMAAATSELLLAKAWRGCGGQGLRGWSRELGSRAWGEGSSASWTLRQLGLPHP